MQAGNASGRLRACVRSSRGRVGPLAGHGRELGAGGGAPSDREAPERSLSGKQPMARVEADNVTEAGGVAKEEARLRAQQVSSAAQEQMEVAMAACLDMSAGACCRAGACMGPGAERPRWRGREQKEGIER